MAPDRRAQDQIVARMMGWANVEPRRMFGSDCYLVSGKMFVFFQGEGVVVKVPSPRREELLADARVAPFTVRPGVRFGDWLHLRLSGPADAAFALPAVEESYRQAQAAPARKRRRLSRRRGPDGGCLSVGRLRVTEWSNVILSGAKNLAADVGEIRKPRTP